MKEVAIPMRPVILVTLVICLAVAMAPWSSGGQEPIAMLVSGGALLLGSLLAWRQPEARSLRMGPLVFSFAALIGFALLSLLWSANRYSSVMWIVQWLMAGMAFKLAYTIAGEKHGREWMLRAYLASAGVFCVAAVVMYFASTYDRLTGTFYWANPAAAYLIPAIVISWDRLRKSSGKNVYNWGVASILFTASFFLTDSRAATLVMLVAGVLYLLAASTPKTFWIKFVFILAMAWGLSLGLTQLSNITVQHTVKVTPGSRLAEAAKGESKSMSDRIYYLRSAFDMWFAHPLTGAGAGTYSDMHPQYQQRVVSASTNAHNIYVQTLAELGLVGAVALAAVLLWLLAGMYRGLFAHPEMLPVACGVLGLLLHFGLDIDAHYPALLMLAAVLSALVYRQWFEKRASARWVGPAAAAVLMVPLISFYQSGVWAQRAVVAQADGDYTTAAERYRLAHEGLFYNPDLINAEGIMFYTLAAGGGVGAQEAADWALELSRQARRADPHDAQHYQLEGRTLVLKKDLAGAEQAFRTALRLDPFNHPDYAADLASVQAQRGDVKGAVETAKAMLGLYPQAVIDNRNMDETLRPSLANLEALLGNLLMSSGDMRQARAAAERSLQLDGKNLRGRALMHQLETSPATISR